MSDDKKSAQVVSICQRLHAKNCLAAADGNVSFLGDDGLVHITPRGVGKSLISAQDMAVMTTEGEPKRGAPSSEKELHLEVYRRAPKAKWVVHAHPPHAIAWSVAFPQMTELPATCLSEVILAVGTIPIVPYARPGGKSLAASISPFVALHRVLILGRHGAIAWGEDGEEAYNGIERLEHSAQILQIARSLGGLTHLPDDEIEVLRMMRQKLGERTL